MKKSIYLAVLLLISFININAQQKEEITKKNIIKTDVSGLLLTQTYALNASYEHLLGKKTSFELQAYIFKYRMGDISFTNFQTGLQASFRYYLNKNDYKMKGFYLSPFVDSNLEMKNRYRRTYLYYNNFYTKTFDINAGLQVGYQFNIKKKWIIDLYTQVSKPIYQKNWNNYYPIRGNYRSDIKINFGVKIGFKF